MITPRWWMAAMLLAGPVAAAGPIELEQLPPERWFDFMIGDWRATAAGGATWTLHVTPILHGQAVQAETENAVLLYSFVGPAREWRMTRVSDAGHHDALLHGRLEDGGRLVLDQPLLRDRADAIGRQSYSAVTTDGFHMDWEVSADQGKTWKVEQAADYKRSEPRTTPPEQTPAALEADAREALQTQLFRLGHWYVVARWKSPDGELPGSGEQTAVVGPDKRSIVETLWICVNNQQRISRVRTYRFDPATKGVTIVNAQAGMPEHFGQIETDAKGWLEHDRLQLNGASYESVYHYELLSPDHYRARRDETPAGGPTQVDALVYDAYRAP